jgi:hypothetical protein
MFDHEKMSEKDQQRYADEMSKAIEADKQAAVDFPPNSGAPLDPEAVKAGKTWDAKARKYVSHQELGAKVYKLKPGWERHFQTGEARYAYVSGLKVVQICYWPEGLERNVNVPNKGDK